MLYTGYTLILLRVKNNMSQQDLAFKMRVPVKKIEEWELDKKVPTQEDFNKLAKIFNVSVENIISGDIARQGAIDLKMFSQLKNPRSYDA